MVVTLVTPRLEYILIWNHGLRYSEAIIRKIQEEPHFQMEKIVKHRVKKVRKLVKEVYSYDYAPFWHLKAKTRYLEKTGEEVLFLFFQNKQPELDLKGEGAFRHIESMTLKAFKEEIRDLYNPRVNGKRSEDHVIHASDNESQTEHMLKYLGYEKGSRSFEKHGILSLPSYMKKNQCYHIQPLAIEELYCRIAIDELSSQLVKIEASPQYQALNGSPESYQNYLQRFRGTRLKENYSLAKLCQLAEELDYLAPGHSQSYILVKKEEGKFVIQDGLHRAAILASRKEKMITVGEIL